MFKRKTMKKTYIAPIVETEDMIIEQMISESLVIDLNESGDEALVPGFDTNKIVFDDDDLIVTL